MEDLHMFVYIYFTYTVTDLKYGAWLSANVETQKL